jgi:parallel beta-helix repeat protein
LTIYGFSFDGAGNGGEGILIEDSSDGLVVSCRIGTNRFGTIAIPNAGPGIRILNSSRNRLQGNLVAASSVGILIEGDSDDNTILGRFGAVGPPAEIPGNAGHGVSILSGRGNLIFGDVVCGICQTTTIVGNGGSGVFLGSGAVETRINGGVGIGSNGGHGIEIRGARDTEMIGGAITSNVGHGVLIADGASGTKLVGAGQTIARPPFIGLNGGAGVFVESGSGNRIEALFDANAGLAIDLAPEGVTPNDPADADADAGPNGLQNWPVLNAAFGASGGTTVTGTFQTEPDSLFELAFYASASCDGSGHGEGLQLLGKSFQSTNASGNASFAVSLPAVAQGRAITATLTHPDGSTSEFSPCIFTPPPVVSMIDPTSEPANHGDTVFIHGLNFQSGARATLGGEPLGTFFVSPYLVLSQVLPPLPPPGTLQPITVTNVDGQSGTLEDAYFVDFLDVPSGHAFHDSVEAVVRADVTAGCGAGLYCVDQPVGRDQIAVFLLTAKNGPSYGPPPATGSVFLDVPISAFAADYIEALSAAGIAAGCGGGNYCPSDPVTRAQSSVLLLRTLEGSNYNPPPAAGTMFLDVPIDAFAAAWIEEIARRGITSGCGGGNFCPDASTTRGEIAVFLVETFGL